MTAAVSISIAYGYDVKAKNDHFVNLAEDAASRLCFAVFPGATLVNALPILQHLPSWFPGAGFHKVASETKEVTTKVKEVPFKWVQTNLVPYHRSDWTSLNSPVTSIITTGIRNSGKVFSV